MVFHLFLVGLLIGLLALLALSVGYRPERSAVGQVRASLRIVQRLAKRDPERYGPVLATHLRLLALELRDSDRPVQALMAAMATVDLIRGLIAKGISALEPQLEEAMVLEDALREVVGVAPDADLLALAEDEEDRLAAQPIRSIAADPGAADPGNAVAGADLDQAEAPVAQRREAPSRVMAYLWQIALAIWILSVTALLAVGLFGG